MALLHNTPRTMPNQALGRAMASSMLPLVLAAPVAPPAAVVTGDRPTSPDLDVAPRIRSGVVIGLSLGAGVAGAKGYPNASSQIGDPADYSASGFMEGSSANLFIMGAISDYLNFGFWFGSGSFHNGDWRSIGSGAGLRVELFPLIAAVPRLAGLGVFGQFGIGGANLQQTSNPQHPEASGVQSFLGSGVLYEWSFGSLFGGHFGAGPSLEYDAMWSQPFERHGLIASARIVFYGGP
jgi:hypothetical protein